MVIFYTLVLLFFFALCCLHFWANALIYNLGIECLCWLRDWFFKSRREEEEEEERLLFHVNDAK